MQSVLFYEWHDRDWLSLLAHAYFIESHSHILVMQNSHTRSWYQLTIIAIERHMNSVIIRNFFVVCHESVHCLDYNKIALFLVTCWLIRYEYVMSWHKDTICHDETIIIIVLIRNSMNISYFSIVLNCYISYNGEHLSIMGVYWNSNCCRLISTMRNDGAASANQLNWKFFPAVKISWWLEEEKFHCVKSKIRMMKSFLMLQFWWKEHSVSVITGLYMITMRDLVETWLTRFISLK